MSEFIGEARIVVRPDTATFATEMQAQLRAITSKPIVVPVVAALSGTVASAAAATSAVASAQRVAQETTLGLAAAADVESSAFGQQATILRGTTVATEELAAAQVAGARAARENAAANVLSTSNLADARRGLIATALSFVGLRGATLAASGGFIAAAAGALAFTKSLSLAANFEKQLNVFRVTAEATASEMGRVSEAAQQLGRDITLPGVSAGDAAETMTELAKAGLSVTDSLNAARGTLQLATAAQIDNAAATELVANALNTFQLSGAEAGRVADLLAGAAKESQGSIVDMGIALKQVAPVAALVNFSVEDTVTILTQLARSGLSASDAGTSFRQALLRLIQDMPKVNKEVERLGLNLRDAQGFIRPEVFGELQKRLAALSPAAREASIAALGGADAIRTFGLLARDGTEAFLETKTAVTEVGLAQEQAAAQTSGLSGDVENLNNQMGALALTFGNLAKGPVSLLVSVLADTISTMNTVATAAVDMGSAFGDAGRKVGDMIPFLDEAVGGLGKIGRAVAPILILPPPLAAAATAMKLFGDETEKSGNKLTVFDGAAKAATSSIGKVAAALRAASDALAAKHPEAGGGLFLGPTEKVDIQGILAGGTEGLEDDLAAAQARLARINARLDDFHGNRNQFAERMREQAQAQADVTRIINQIASRNAADARQAADNLASAQRQADAALLQTFSVSREQAQNRIAAAQNTAGLKDDIRRQQELGALVRGQIAAIRKRITDAAAERAAVAALTAILRSVDAALKGLRAQQRQLAEERRQTVTDVLGQRLQLAELRGQKDAILAALNASIADARRRVKAAKTLTDRLNEQIALQELINQKNELLAKEAEKGKDQQGLAAKFFFEQLQAQQGFAANLLGNLIPKGQTAGLVGVPSPTQAPVDVGVGLGAAAGVAEGKSATSPTAGQHQTTNQILRGILHQLTLLTGKTESPEAVYQSRQGRALMDNGGGYLGTM